MYIGRFLLLCILGWLFISGIAMISVALLNETPTGACIVRHQGNASKMAISLTSKLRYSNHDSMTIQPGKFLSLMITWTHRVLINAVYSRDAKMH
ncbi:hypothetical protein K445DRAFT_193848 [Daldinia sp. EC12]|nr:hypothetical protein F4774DRAFT_133361 [Daldinia eschscholtzii]OTB19359.1 hypothetical protein K445DRAFT_193848 [Daldinia sp. EC12]